MIRILTALLILTLSGCATQGTIAQYEAGSMLINNECGVCRHRVVKLAQRMIDRQDIFDVVFGTQSGTPHVRIEQWTANGLVLVEPSVSDYKAKYFIEGNRWRINQGDKYAEVQLRNYIAKVEGER